jgi:hypothetical protein
MDRVYGMGSLSIRLDRVHDGAKAIVSSSAHAVDCGIVKVRLQRPERHGLRLLSILEQHMEDTQLFYVLPAHFAYQHYAILGSDIGGIISVLILGTVLWPSTFEEYNSISSCVHLRDTSEAFSLPVPVRHELFRDTLLFDQTSSCCACGRNMDRTNRIYPSRPVSLAATKSEYPCSVFTLYSSHFAGLLCAAGPGLPYTCH